METSRFSPKLNNVQLHLLRFFSERTVSDEETAEIQRIIARYYAQKADRQMDELWQQRGYTDQTMDDILNTPLKKISRCTWSLTRIICWLRYLASPLTGGFMMRY